MRARTLAPAAMFALLFACGQNDEVAESGRGGTAGAAGSAGGAAGAGGSAASGGAGAQHTGFGGSQSDAGDAAAADAAVPPCEFDMPLPPPSSVLWPAELSAAGAETLGGHGHDDGKGPLGFCPGQAQAGAPFYRLLAVGFESDTDVTGDGQQDDPLPVDFWKDAQSFTGLGESQGRINVYVEIVDENGAVLNADDHPEIRIARTIKDGPSDLLPLTTKPATEFQTNFPMSGGARYGVAIEGASDRVINLRLPVNHHVTFTLVFRRQQSP